MSDSTTEQPGEASMSRRVDTTAPSQPFGAPPVQLPFPDQQEAVAPPQQEPLLQRLLQRMTGTTLPNGQHAGLQLSITTSQRALQPPEAGSLSPRLSALVGRALSGAEHQQAAPPAAGPALPPLQPNGQPDAEASLEGLEGRAAEAAERYRLNTSLANVDIRQLAISLERGLPFMVLFSLLFVYRHAVGLLSFGWLTYVLHRLNNTVRSQVALKSQLERKQLVLAAGVVLLQVLLVIAVTWKTSMHKNLVFFMRDRPEGLQFWEAVFAIMVGDVLARYMAVLLKVLVLLFSKAETSQQFRRRGHVLTAVEHVLAVWRELLPTPIWYAYLEDVPGSAALGMVWAGVYVCLKFSPLNQRATVAFLSIRQAWQKAAYGCTPTAQEIAEVGNSCPICQENLRDPTKLPCSHIYCSDCLLEWLERGGNCPMCRATIRPNQVKSYADGHTSLLPIIF